MGTYKRYCKNIIKQYGKHILRYEERLNNPIETKKWIEFKKNIILIEELICLII